MTIVLIQRGWGYMNKIKTTFFFFLGFSFPLYAQIQDKDLVYDTLRKIEASMSTEIDELKVCFPEYLEAFSHFQEATAVGTEKAISNMTKASNKLNEVMVRPRSEVESIKNLLSRDPKNSAYLKLLEDAQKRYDETLATEEEGLKEVFKESAELLVYSPIPGLDRVPFDAHWVKGYKKHFAPTNIMGKTLIYPLEKGHPDKINGRKALRKVFGTTGRTSKGLDKFITHDLILKKAGTIQKMNKGVFAKCKTAGCVYLLNEQIKKRVKAFSGFELAHKSSVGKASFQFEKINPKRIDLVLDKVAQGVAATKEIGDFSIPECKLSERNSKIDTTAREQNKDVKEIELERLDTNSSGSIQK